jgi:GntR family transcriptional regulator/MocR family aminotransferase
LRYRLGFGHLNEEEIEIIVRKLKQAYDLTLK